MLAHRVEYADLYFQYSRAESWSLEEGIVKSGSFGIEQGVGVRAVSGDKTAFAYSDDISLAALESAAHATRAIARQGGAQSVPMTEGKQQTRIVPCRMTRSVRSMPPARSRCWNGWSATRVRSIRASPR